MEQFIRGDYGFPEGVKGNVQLFTNRNVARALTELPKGDNSSKFARSWHFEPVDCHLGCMVATHVELRFAPREYTMRPNYLWLSLTYKVHKDDKQCILTVKSSYEQADATNWHKDTRPADFTAPNPDLEFDLSFQLRGSFTEMLEELKRIYLNAFCLHMRGLLYEK